MPCCVTEDDALSSSGHGDVSLPSDVVSTSSVSDRFNVPWGCELDASRTTAVFEVEDDLLENQFYVRTVCLGAGASDELHVVAVCDCVGGGKAVPIVSLRHSLPMVSFPCFEVMPPVTFTLCSGPGPVFIFGQHLALSPEDDE